jgi:hypothetical protein
VRTGTDVGSGFFEVDPSSRFSVGEEFVLG